MGRAEPARSACDSRRFITARAVLGHKPLLAFLPSSSYELVYHLSLEPYRVRIQNFYTLHFASKILAAETAELKFGVKLLSRVC